MKIKSIAICSTSDDEEQERWFPWFRCYPKHLKKMGLTYKEIEIVYCLFSYMNESYVCWPSLQTIGDSIDQDARNIARSINKLKALNLIEISKRKIVNSCLQSNIYNLTNLVQKMKELHIEHQKTIKSKIEVDNVEEIVNAENTTSAGGSQVN